MRHVQLLVITSLLFVEAMVIPARGTAQTPVDPGQLPGRTNFYLLWRGTPSGEISARYVRELEARVHAALGIRDKPNALKLARTLMGDRITSERNEGDTTFIKISLQGGKSSAGMAQWNFYCLAMKPTLLFGSSKSEMLHKYVGQTPANPGAALSKNALASRAQYPEELNGFSDFQKVDWAGLKASWMAQANKSAQTAKTTDASNNTQKFADWLNQVDPELFPRHLHTMAGASWKDAKGVHFDGWLD